MPLKSKTARNGHETQQARPFLKWAGGKRKLLGELVRHLPSTYSGIYHEPFLGGGALFFELAARGYFEKAHLSDVNEELVNAYKVVRSHVEELIRDLKKHVHSSEYYYKLRSIDPEKLNTVRRASRLIYLNRTCYNGLYRVNSKGRFNVPFGRYKNPNICDEKNLRLCSKALKKVVLSCRSFDSITRDVSKGDLIYFDPPYHPVSRTSNFASYQKDGFKEEDQQQLKEVFEALDGRDCFVMLSNSYTPFTSKLFEKFKPKIVEASRAVNSKASGRGPIKEIIVRNY